MRILYIAKRILLVTALSLTAAHAADNKVAGLQSGSVASGAHQQNPMIIQNEFLRVTVDPVQHTFALSSLPDGKTVVAAGKLSGVGETAKRVPVSSKIFGSGLALEMFDANGAGGSITVFPHLPFALLRGTLKNNGAAAQVVNRVPLASFQAVSEQTATALTTLGTGGLLPADKNPGSYAWLAVAEPQSRHGVVAGWLTHDRASGVLFSKIEDGKVSVEVRSDYGRLHLAPGASTTTETLAIGYFDDARLGLEAWADAVAGVYAIKLPAAPVGFCTWYAEKHGGSSDEQHVAELSGDMAKTLNPFGFNFVQIDDGWQLGDSKGNGPRKNFTDYNPQGPYPTGMKATADTIKAHGQMPGIWFMPFAGTYNDPWFQAHQDWFVKHEDGKPFDTAWGGTSLDMTNPATQQYLRSIVDRIAHQWGYTYFKMDGLYTGLAAQQVYVNSGYKEDDFGAAVFANADKTNVEAFRDGLKLVRQTAGPGVFFLGCTCTQNMRSYAASFGLVNAMRIGPDNNGSWDGWSKSSPVFGSRHYFVNGRIWYNDPDPNYERASISTDEARTIASWPAIAGQLNSNGDWMPDLPADRLEILKRTMPSHHATARPVDLFENDPPRLWTVSDEQRPTRRDVIALFNWADGDTSFDTPLTRFGLPPAPAYAAFDYWANTFLPPLTGNLKTTLAKHSCQIIAVRPLLERPFLLSTSRHITQGMVDVLDEKWDGRRKALEGQSLVVGGDPYELRIYAPQQAHPWAAIRAELSAADVAAGAAIKFNQSEAGVRATITAPMNRTIHWKLSFKTAHG